MNNVARMVMLAKGKEMPDNRYYENESRFMDRRGKPHYDNGRYAPRGDGGMWVEGTHSNYERPEGRYDDRINPSYGYYEDTQMNKIGFALDGEMERLNELDHDYESNVSYPFAGEMRTRCEHAETGEASPKSVHPLTREKAEAWAKKLQNEDGTTGAHWNYDQTKQVITQKGLECDPVEFYAAMNMIYSDYSKVAKRLGINNIDFYVEMAKAFLDDKDAPHDKLARYYQYIVEA